MNILSKYATATESLTIDANCFSYFQHGIMEYLAQMDCKQIIVLTQDFQFRKLQEFFNCKSKAKKFIDYYGQLDYTIMGQIEWASNYFSQKCLDRGIEIFIKSYINNDAQALFERLFKGALKLFKHKRIITENYFDFRGNICIPNGDTDTQSLYTTNFNIAVLALNNCTGLIKLEISNIYGSLYYNQLQIILNRNVISEADPPKQDNRLGIDGRSAT